VGAASRRDERREHRPQVGRVLLPDQRGQRRRCGSVRRTLRSWGACARPQRGAYVRLRGGGAGRNGDRAGAPCGADAGPVDGARQRPPPRHRVAVCSLLARARAARRRAAAAAALAGS
jgi:hypothetical protein